MKTIVKSEKWALGSFLAEIPNYPVNVLIRLFGQPVKNPCEKVQYEWNVSYQEDGQEIFIFRIYDYYGDRWHIGGEATSRLKGGFALGEHRPALRFA